MFAKRQPLQPANANGHKRRGSFSAFTPWLATGLVVIGALVWAWFLSGATRTAPPREVAQTKPRSASRPTPSESLAKDFFDEVSSKSSPTAGSAEKESRTTKAISECGVRVENVTIRDQQGRIVFEGTIDLGATLARIDAGKRLMFRNDGTVFQNREKRLPAQPGGYYREWVHPTPNVGGPGPQRIVSGGNNQEFYYTHDHYRTFRRIRR